MYFIDRNKIEHHLLYMDGLLQELEHQRTENLQEKLALERMTQLVIESIIDVGNMMIDGFIMRDPGSYEDIIEILVDERVIPEDESDDYKSVVELRKVLVRDYLNVSHEQIMEVMKKHYHAIEKFSERIRHYLTTELGPVSAFKND